MLLASLTDDVGICLSEIPPSETNEDDDKAVATPPAPELPLLPSLLPSSTPDTMPRLLQKALETPPLPISATIRALRPRNARSSANPTKTANVASVASGSNSAMRAPAPAAAIPCSSRSQKCCDPVTPPPDTAWPPAGVCPWRPCPIPPHPLTPLMASTTAAPRTQLSPTSAPLPPSRTVLVQRRRSSSSPSPKPWCRRTRMYAAPKQ
ncbi:hypothetical protein Vretimale_4619 [Volvox reticuliferus]|uniref:Uncharacterized protein n=1 Tax=Volvox reticuliferus TaxID=1737510 RepID=A0A8J4DHE4_9CHLO|nr:hypothetical protein Vretifemale_3215 [Volvox reticuliferus]GIL99461.1 hypothetical protein Vretimale_4619 [Volvox reticuliferus]